MKLTFSLTLLLASAIFCHIHAQCNQQLTISVCDITVIDGNNDGNFDGIINLYNEYTNATGLTIQAGEWYDPNFNFALNEVTGDLYLWDLDNASESETDYQFQLFNSSCGNEVALTINVIVGPFSGVAVPAFGSDVNVEICDVGIDPCGSSTNYDLFQALLSVPSAHANGVWTYEGNSPNFIGIVDSYFMANVPYTPGPPLVDEETFELVYTVQGIDPCAPIMETRVKVSVIRDVFAGAPNNYNLCESEITESAYGNIDLRNDAYLVNEDIEGIWLANSDRTGQISGAGDSVIDFKQVYDELYATNPRFGCETYGYTYFVESRSPVCDDKSSTVTFTIFEELRPFSQTVDPPEFCVDDPSNGTFDLYSLLEFTTENGELYDYPNNLCTNWSLLSGPSTLGLVSKSSNVCEFNASYTSKGTIDLRNITNAEAGTYTFQYTVLPEYNCSANVTSPEVIFQIPDGCSYFIDGSHPCAPEYATVTIIIHPKNYAGEDTGILEFCESAFSAPVDLIPLLNSNGIDDPIYTGSLGNWTNADTGVAVDNPFSIPEVVDQQVFNLIYTTTTENDCVDTAKLTFRVYEDYQAGTDGSVSICSDDTSVNLFDYLNGYPNDNGSWTGPNSFSNATNDLFFDASTMDAGNYVYNVPENGNGSDVICPSTQATVLVTIIQNLNAGQSTQTDLCRSDRSVDLNDLLHSSADAGGTFNDIEATGVLSGSVVDLTNLSIGSYNFEYQIQGSPDCEISKSVITITIIDVEAPTSQNQQFCLTDVATVGDLVVSSNTLGYNWYDSATSTTALLHSDRLTSGTTYYVANLDANGCESDRIGVSVTILPFNDDRCTDCEINDGISVNGDSQNDVLDLCTLPEVFPNFEITIYNRYGSIVYKGNRNTAPFNGTSNVSVTIGDQLPSGVYYYIFDPKDNENTQPFQGDVYLAR